MIRRHVHHFLLSALLGVLAFAVILVASARAAHAYEYTVCVRFQIQTADSATSTSVPREDHWLNADNGAVVPAYGVYLNVYKNGSSVTGGNVVAGASNGCYTFTSAQTGPFDMRVYARARDAKGNSVRIHDAGPGDLSDYPGSTYSIYLSSVSLLAGQSVAVTVGGGSPRWTMMAAAAFTLYRFNDGNSNTEIHIAEDTTSSCANSSSWSSSNDDVDVGRGYVRIKTPSASCGSEGRNLKFLIAHEMGHVLLRMHAGLVEGPKAATFPYGALMGSNGVASCTNDSSYDMNSVEWGSLAFKEGSADFVAAKVFNDRSTEGRFIRFGQLIDLEHAPVPDAGGRLVNTCNISSSNGWGLGIRSDWLRFWWDWYTQDDCASTPTKLEVMGIFAKTLERHWDGTQAYADETAFGAVRAAMFDEGLSSCLEERWVTYACWNGIDRQTGVANDSCY